MSRVLIFTAKRSGTHFFSRMISRSLNVSWGVSEIISTKPNLPEKFVFAHHTPINQEFVDLSTKENINIFGIYRNPYDHAVSLFNMFKEHEYFSNIDDLIKSELFLQYRTQINQWSEENMVSYDIIIDENHKLFDEEIEKLRILSGSEKIIYEKWENRFMHHKFYWSGLKSGYHKNILSKKQIKKIAEIEELAIEKAKDIFNY